MRANPPYRAALAPLGAPSLCSLRCPKGVYPPSGANLQIQVSDVGATIPGIQDGNSAQYVYELCAAVAEVRCQLVATALQRVRARQMPCTQARWSHHPSLCLKEHGTCRAVLHISCLPKRAQAMWAPAACMRSCTPRRALHSRHACCWVLLGAARSLCL